MITSKNFKKNCASLGKEAGVKLSILTTGTLLLMLHLTRAKQLTSFLLYKRFFFKKFWLYLADPCKMNMSSTMFHAPYMLHSAIHFLQNNTLFRKRNTSVKYMFWGNILTAHEHITVSCVIVCWNQSSKKSFPYRSPYRTHAFLFSGAFVFLTTIDGVVVFKS